MESNDSHQGNNGAESKFELRLGDSLEVLQELDPGSVDLVFADPPYYLSNDGITCSGGEMVSVNKGEWDKSPGIEEAFDFHRAWLGACRRVLKDDGTLWVSGTYHSIFACGHALQLDDWHLLNDIIWFKPNAPPNLSRRMFTASHEVLIWAKKSHGAKHTFNYDAMREGDFPRDSLKKPGKQMRSVWSIPPPSKAEKEFGKHPTQKPVELLERIVLASSLPNELVLDPFCGSGTTGVAALRHGRRFMGIDSDKEFLEGIAAPRLSHEERNLRLDFAA